MDFIPGLFFMCKIFPGGYFYEGDYFGYFGIRDVFIPPVVLWKCSKYECLWERIVLLDE